MSLKVLGSLNLIWLCCSDITTASLPSGVKYRLYGRGTDVFRPRRAVFGLIDTSSLAALEFV
jgi:hypothetical protein